MNTLSTASQVRVRDKYQITLPSVVARAANIELDDILNIQFRSGVVTLVSPSAQKKRPSLMALAGSSKGLYGKNTKERQAYIANERASWAK